MLVIITIVVAIAKNVPNLFLPHLQVMQQKFTTKISGVLICSNSDQMIDRVPYRPRRRLQASLLCKRLTFLIQLNY